MARSGPVRAIIAGIFGAVLVVLGYWLYERLSPEAGARDVVLDGAELALNLGRGGITARGLEIHEVSGSGVAAVVGRFYSLRAKDYQSVTWDASGLTDALAVKLLWRITTDPQTTRTRLLTSAELRAGAVDMVAQPGWEGELRGIGFLVAGPLKGEIRFGRVGLTAKPPALKDSLASLARTWGYWEPWTARSINFYAEAASGSRLTPVAMVAAWIGLSLVIYRLAGGAPLRARGRLAATLFFLVGWLALDVRWQWVLQERLALTQPQEVAPGDGDVASVERTLSEGEIALRRAAQQMRRRLPRTPSRVFILSADPGAYVPGRLRYLLAPHRGYLGRSRLPSRRTAYAGDYVLIVPPLDTIRYDPLAHLLRSSSHSLPAELVYAGPFGSLFVVQSG